MTEKRFNPDSYVFCLPAPPERHPYLIVGIDDFDDGGFIVSILIHERRDLGSHLGECVALVPKDVASLDRAVENMTTELLEIDDDPVRMAEQVEDSMNPDQRGGTNDRYSLAWEPARFDSDGARYHMPDTYRITDADEIALLRGFMKLVAGKLRSMQGGVVEDKYQEGCDPFPTNPDSEES